jgi:hypothetical protein
LDGGEGGEEGDEQDGPQTPEPDNGEEESEDDSEDEPTDPAAALPQQEPGLYGNAYGLQVDVSRLPRLDEYATGPLGPRPTDVKTVAWYVRGGPAVDPHSPPSEWRSAGGLVRRELDRAATLWAADNGGLTGLELELAPIAPEVASLEFSYFDGVQWRSDWDSQELGGRPVAVRIVLALAPPGSIDVEEPQLGTTMAGQTNAGEVQFYTLLVRLPAAEKLEDSAAPVEEEEAEEEEEEGQQQEDPGQNPTPPQGGGEQP